MTGADNPNYGNRKPGMFQHSEEFRLRLSEDRRGASNPNWRGGRQGAGEYGLQTYARRWALRHLGERCQLCGSQTSVEVHHIVARRFFRPASLANFPQNLMVLCRPHHRQIDGNGKGAAPPPREIPFVDRVPESILQALERDGWVSSLPEGLSLIQLELLRPADYRRGAPKIDRRESPASIDRDA